MVTAHGHRPFSLAEAPLLRASLLRLDEEEHVLLLTTHHIASDGWSSSVLMGELSALYEAFREGRETPLPELKLQYADYAVWQRGHLQGELLETQLAYWRAQLADVPQLLELPTDRPRPATSSYRGAALRFTLTRAWDWLNTPADALVTRKDPLAFLRRLDTYAARVPEMFAL